ncbi:hypothetical protein SAY87_001446 [Trapa incisa]|uniref:Uncharacterized protein n=1 Tax=Trapa incisa TaxID=236973 RepID=A0AAN7GII8_9MYRT|nr:hypothetical protein SAY87_001446 [Trapa incisa]
MDSALSRFRLLLLVVVTTAALCSIPAVGSEPQLSSSAIRLPSQKDANEDLCYGSVQPASCPIKCFRTDPVCGADGVTYWCGCADAACAGVRVAKLRFCEVGSGGSGPVPGQALLLLHIVWLIVLGFSLLFGLF